MIGSGSHAVAIPTRAGWGVALALMAWPAVATRPVVGGFLQLDHTQYHRDTLPLDGDPDDGPSSDRGVRRAVLFVFGGEPNRRWIIGYDFQVKLWLDVGITLTSADQRHQLQIGQFKLANGLETINPGRDRDFVASIVTDTFTLNRRATLSYHHHGERGGATVGVFGREVGQFGFHGSGQLLRGYRVWQPDGWTLHAAFSLVDHDTPGDLYRIAGRPGSDRPGARVIDSGPLRDTDRVRLLGIEALALHGAWKWQAEFLRSAVTRDSADTYHPQGWYAALVWNLGNEAWGYERGVVVMPRPKENALLWQLALRHEVMELDDGETRVARVADGLEALVVDGVLGGRVRTLTLGANLYWR